MPAVATYDNPEAYIAGDRRQALLAGIDLPDRVSGAALFADISGFTPLTEALATELGAAAARRSSPPRWTGSSASLLGHCTPTGGSVVYFSGDAVTCWLDARRRRAGDGLRLAMQQAMAAVGVVTTPGGPHGDAGMKVAVAVGAVRRFVVGDP